MKELKKLLSTVRQASDRYGMIEDGARIAVGLSGGKDSAALLLALAKMQPSSNPRRAVRHLSSAVTAMPKFLPETFWNS